MAGDEANMLSELCTCPVAVAVDRARAGRELLKRFPGLDLLISDDGLQHYALARDIEIIVKREAALGNGFCLPAGPLREPPGRLDQCDLLIDRDAPALSEHLGDCWNLMHPRQSRPLASFARQNPHALAGIAFPGTFFEALRRHGLQIEARAFPDHHDFRRDDLPDDGRPILVTHKDAVKLRAFAMENIWVVPLELQLPDDLQYRLLKIVESSLNG